MKLLLIGSGGREHALAWKLAQSPQVETLHCAPGNAGIAEVADIVDIKADDIIGLLALAQREAYDFVVVGPEQPLRLYGFEKSDSLLKKDESPLCPQS